MLVPLVATPIGDPLANMLVQGWLTTVAALLAPFLAARYLGAGRYWFATGTLANAFFLVTFSDEFQFEWLVKQPYALSMSLAAASLLVAQRRGFAAAVASMTLMLLAHWVNLTVLVIVVPLILVRRSFEGPSLCAMGIGPAGGLLIRYLSNAPPFTRTEILPIAQWPHACFMLLRTTLGEVAHPRLFEVAVAVSAIAATALWIKPRHSEPLKAASIAVFVGCIYMSVSGTSLHVQLNHFMPRYVLPSVSLFGVAIALVLVASAGDRPKLVALAAVVALVTASVVSYGIPSVKRLRRTIDSRFGMMTQQALAAGATVIVGDYWTVWPAVFHANLALYERRSTRRVFGLTYRSEVTDALWLSGGEAKQILVVGYQSDSSIDAYLARIRLLVTFMGSSGKLAIYRISAD